MNKDLTVGDPAKVLWKFCLPLFGSIIFQQLYNIADSFVAGKFIGENALAAVGNSYEITLIFIAFAFGCNIGCSVIVSQLFGAKKLGEMKTAVYTTFIASAVLCALLMLAGTLGCNGMLRLINTPENVFADSKLYLDIYIMGLPFVFFYNVATGIFSALGDSKTPFIFLAASSTSNIFMDILFVTAFKMGVAGVAWATFLCQGVSCVLAVLFVLRRLKSVETEEKSAIFSFPLFCRIAVIAVPSILQQSFISVGNIVIQGVINSFGSSVMAGYSASVKLNNLVITSLTTLGNGISNFTAQNIGASKMDRVRDGFRAGLKLVWMLCLPIVVLYLLGGRMLVNIFMNEPSEAADGLRRAVPADCVAVLLLGFLQAGFRRRAARCGADERIHGCDVHGFDSARRLAIGLSKVLGVTGVWCAWPIGWTIAMVLSVLFYRRGPWEKQKA